jgi:hypothetical protein
MMVIAHAVTTLMLAVGFQTGSAEIPIPTPVERGLVERACKDTADAAANQTCRDEKLVGLRADFGKDLSKVKADDRKKVDATCTPLLADAALKGKEPYFECMLAQLTALKTKGRKPANAAAPDAAAAPADAPAADSAPAPPPPAAGRSTGTLIAGVLGVIALVGGLGFVVMRARGPKTKKCQSCGADTPADNESEFCENCRKQMAGAIRQRKADQADQARRDAEEAKRESEQKARRLEMQKAREAEERKVREYEELKQREYESKVAEASRPNTPEPEPPDPYAAEVFDPHAILGVKRDATADAIAAAYQAAKKKYDPDLVGHLSEEVQAHYREKSQMVDKAYQTLTGSQPA